MQEKGLLRENPLEPFPVPLVLVLDASAAVGEVLRRRGEALLTHEALVLCVAEETWSEIQHELPKRIARLAKKKALEDHEAGALLEKALGLLEASVQRVPREAYAPWEKETKLRIPQDPQDWPVAALALSLRVAIWSTDGDFCGSGIPVWHTQALAAWLGVGP